MTFPQGFGFTGRSFHPGLSGNYVRNLSRARIMISSHAVVDLEIFEGATFYQEFTWRIGTPALPVDLTGYTAALQARDAYEDDATAIDLTTETGGIIILLPESDGGYAISIPPSITKDLCPGHEKRTLLYDLFFYAPADADDAGLQQKGKIVINPAVTRPGA